MTHLRCVAKLLIISYKFLIATQRRREKQRTRTADGNVKDHTPISSTQGNSQSGSYYLLFTGSNNNYPRAGTRFTSNSMEINGGQFDNFEGEVHYRNVHYGNAHYGDVHYGECSD